MIDLIGGTGQTKWHKRLYVDCGFIVKGNYNWTSTQIQTCTTLYLCKIANPRYLAWSTRGRMV